METFQEVVGSVPVAAHTHIIGHGQLKASNPLCPGVAKEIVQFAGKWSDVIYCQFTSLNAGEISPAATAADRPSKQRIYTGFCTFGSLTYSSFRPNLCIRLIID